MFDGVAPIASVPADLRRIGRLVIAPPPVCPARTDCRTHSTSAPTSASKSSCCTGCGTQGGGRGWRREHVWQGLPARSAMRRGECSNPLHRRCFGALHAIQQRDSVHLSACSNTSSGGLGGRSRAHAITSSTSCGAGDRRALPAHIGSQMPAVAPPRNERVDSGGGEWEQHRGQDEQHDGDGGDHDFSHFSARRSGWSSTISRRLPVCCGFGVCDRRERYGGRRCATRSSTAQLSPTRWLMETSHLLA